MHCASAANLPGVALFGKVEPNLRLPPDTAMQALYDVDDVNNISPQVVAEIIRARWTAAVIAAPGSSG